MSVYTILVRKILLVALNVFVITLLMVFTMALCALLGYLFPLVWFPAVIGLLLGVMSTVLAILAIRRRTWQADIEYEAARWLAKRSVQQSNARRNFRAALRQCLLWLPSILAAFVLFFYPVASRIVHPGDYDLPHYRVAMPWTWIIGPRYTDFAGSYVGAFIYSEGSGRFGMTPHWRQDTPSVVYFRASGRSSENELSYERLQRTNVTKVSRLELNAGHSPLTCWQYALGGGIDWGVWGSEGPWRVVCETPSNVTDRNFYGSFTGRKEDLLAFYEVLAKVKSVD